jgi:hypothetical protein
VSENLTFQRSMYEDLLSEPVTFRGVRLPALALDQMLAAGSSFTDRGLEPLPPYDALQLHVFGGQDRSWLNVHATDRYSAYRESSECMADVDPGATFLLHRADATALRAMLKVAIKSVEKESRDVLPVDLMWDDSGVLEVVCEDRRATLTERETEDGQTFPDIFALIEPALAATDGPLDPLDFAVNAELLARLKPMQKHHGVFRFQRGRRKKPDQHGVVLAQPLNAWPGDIARTCLVLFMPVRPSLEVDA